MLDLLDLEEGLFIVLSSIEHPASLCSSNAANLSSTRRFEAELR